MMSNLIRFKEMIPNWEYPRKDLPGPYQHGVYRYVDCEPLKEGDPAPPMVVDSDFKFSITICDPGKGAYLHSHSEYDEFFFALTGSWCIFFGDKGQDKVVLEPWDAINVPVGVQRGFMNVSKEQAYLLVVVGGPE
jgi:mannose-6-phosphate isomerase-like protein (cupin superfamily)